MTIISENTVAANAPTFQIIRQMVVLVLAVPYPSAHKPS